MKYVREGLNEIVPPSTLLMLSAKDIALALSGNCELDVSEVFHSYIALEFKQPQSNMISFLVVCSGRNALM